MWQKALKVLGTVAPTLAAAIGGPLAGQAVQFLGSALGLPSDTAEDHIAKAVAAATPEQLLLLKKADQEFAVRMRELDIDVERINAADRDSARRRQVETGDMTPAFIAAAVLLVWGYAQWVLIHNGMPQGLTEAVLARLLGMLDAAALVVLYYYFGSSNQTPKK
jgi:hypothetical protein